MFISQLPDGRHNTVKCLLPTASSLLHHERLCAIEPEATVNASPLELFHVKYFVTTTRNGESWPGVPQDYQKSPTIVHNNFPHYKILGLLSASSTF